MLYYDIGQSYVIFDVVIEKDNSVFSAFKVQPKKWHAIKPSIIIIVSSLCA